MRGEILEKEVGEGGKNRERKMKRGVTERPN